METKLLKTTDVEEILSVSKSVVRRLIDSGKLKIVEIAANKKRRLIRIHPDDLAEYINTQRKSMQKPEQQRRQRKTFKIKRY